MVEVEREKRRRTAIRRVPADPAAFLAQTQIETPEAPSTRQPFVVWPSQAEVLHQLGTHRLITILKARQLGVSWLLCGYVLWLCAQRSGQTALLFSQGQLEANELIRRISLMHYAHTGPLPGLPTDNVTELEWANGSRVISLPATRRAGRSFTASIAILDEFAFMFWGQQVLAAVKPTIDAGGQLVVLSSADGPGTPFHRFWQEAEAGLSGYHPIFLPWTARPDRGPNWRDQKLAESGGDTASVLREYPANAFEAFTAAADLVYGAQWADPGNVTEDAEYVEGGGPVLWGVDDGYAGKRDSATGGFTAESHPRVFGLYQLRHDGTLCRFAESYAVGLLSEQHLDQVLALPYPRPIYAVVDKSAAELKARLHAASIYTRNGPSDVEESIKECRRALAPDANGRRRLLVHPRCTQFRLEMTRYRNGPDGSPIKAFDHGPDEARYLVWSQRLVQ